jgi:hypothetical protein
MRLASLGAGKWQNSGGDKAKFGLNPRQLLDLWKKLRDAGMADCLQLLHFHMGSQISNVRDISNGMREAVRYFVELTKLGATISHVDVGGGLGVDYEGTRSRSYNSVNYGIRQYAGSIVQPLAQACAEEKWDDAARLAQDIVGAAGGLGLLATTQAARKFATAAREGESRHRLRNAAQMVVGEHIRARQALAQLYPDIA